MPSIDLFCCDLIEVFIEIGAASSEIDQVIPTILGYPTANIPAAR